METTQSFEIEFGSKTDATHVREQFPDALSNRDDRRLKSVRFDEGELTESERDEIVAIAERGRAERAGPGQVSLTKNERNRIDFTKGRASVPHARSVKAIMLDAGVDDWTAFYDPTLTVDEHRGIARQAAQDVRGERLDVHEEDRPRGRLERAVGERCTHAEGFCRRGDPGACEFLSEACGFDEDEIDAIMGIDVEEPTPIEDLETPFTGRQLGALRRSWGGYKGAITDLEIALDDVKEAEQHATDAIEAVNAIRAKAGQDPLAPERLEEIRSLQLADVCRDREGPPVEQLDMAASSTMLTSGS